MVNVKEIEDIIGYRFKNKELLKTAFLHSSQGFPNNERLEYLGDTVLDLAIADKLFLDKNDMEGNLTKKRASIVCESNLAEIVKKYDLHSFIVFGNSFKSKPSNAVCADLFESIIGAIYLDNDRSMVEVRKFVDRFIDMNVCNSIDYKTSLQEIIQKDKNAKLYYRTIEIEQDKNEHKFECVLYLNGKIQSKAKGKSKKEAERNAAKALYEKMKGDSKL